MVSHLFPQPHQSVKKVYYILFFLLARGDFRLQLVYPWDIGNRVPLLKVFPHLVSGVYVSDAGMQLWVYDVHNP